MSDLIDRQTAIDALNEVSKHYTNKGREWHPHINFMVDAIKDLPSAELEQKTGKWIKCGYWSEGVGMGETYGSCYKCSECGIEVQAGEDRCKMNFCYNCGAKMEDEKEIDFFTQGHLHLGEAEVEE